MRLGTLTTCALAALAAFTGGCGGGTPAPDSTIGASPASADPGSSTGATADPDTARPLGTVSTVTPVPNAGPATRPRPAAPDGGSRGAAAPAQAPGADTVRGIVSEVGSFPMTSVVVRPASGGAITITGPLAGEIARAAGAEVWVSGDRDARSIAARSYAVRTVDGEPAVDGTLARDGDGLVLVTATGRRPIARPLRALRGMIGARVWLVGPLDGTITSYGILREP